MAQANTFSYGYIPFLLEDPVTAGTYGSLCGITGRGFKLSNGGNDIFIPDCLDEDLLSYREHEFHERMLDIDGDGKLTKESLPRYMDWFFEGNEINARIPFLNADKTIFAKIDLVAKLTDIDVKGTKGDRHEVSLSIKSHGVFTWTKI